MASSIVSSPKLHEMSDQDIRQMLDRYVPSFRLRMDRGAGDLIGDLEEIIRHRLWERVGYGSLAEYSQSKLQHSENWCHEVIRIYNEDWSPEQRANGTVKDVLTSAERREKIAELKASNPSLTQQQIADIVGLSQRRVGQIRSELEANATPKLLNHGGKREKQAEAPQLAHGSKAHIISRLYRDGNPDLAEKVRKGEVTAKDAAIQAGFGKQRQRRTVPVDSPTKAVRALLKVFTKDELLAALQEI